MKVKHEMAVKIDCFPYICAARSHKSLGLIQIQTGVKAKSFSLFEKKIFIMGFLIYLCILVHIFVAILIKVPLPHAVVITVEIFR